MDNKDNISKTDDTVEAAGMEIMNNAEKTVGMDNNGLRGQSTMRRDNLHQNYFLFFPFSSYFYIVKFIK